MSGEVKKIAAVKAAGESFPLFFFGPGSSSIDAAWGLIAQNRLPAWGAVLMESQSGGRGRMGRVWQSPPGNIYGALRLPSGQLFTSPGASLALALMLSEALASFGWQMRIKWPNDLIFEDGKTGGLLLESRGQDLVAGIGLNLGAPPAGGWQKERDPGAPKPGALPFFQGPETLWPGVVKELVLLYNKKFGTWTMAELAREAEKILLWRGRSVRVERPASDPPAPDGGLSGLITGLGPEGQLRLAGPDGEYYLWSGTLYLTA